MLPFVAEALFFNPLGRVRLRETHPISQDSDVEELARDLKGGRNLARIVVCNVE